jgi:glutamyl-tRNA synthetase
VAVFNWLFTRHHGGRFVLRVEDTDLERNVPGAEEALMEDLRWLGLDWDEGPDVGGAYGPYRQSEREVEYAAYLGRLLEAGAAYRCFCPEGEGTESRRYPGTCRGLEPEEVQARLAQGAPHVVRFRAPLDGEVGIVDEVRGPISFPASDIDDFVLRRRDGRPTYNFAVVVDDVTMEITHVIRGGGHLSNTPKQALLFDAFGHARPAFVHLPNVLAPDGGKLSKRHGATGVGELRDAGVLPGAIVNYLSLLGWSHPEEREVLSLQELVDSVDLDRVRAAEMAYDPEKLGWVGSQHLASLTLNEVVQGVRPFVDPVRCPFPGEGLTVAVEAIRSRLSAFGEARQHLEYAYPIEGREWEKLRGNVREDSPSLAVVRRVREGLEALDEWSREGIRSVLKGAGQELGVRGPALFHPIRKALFASDSGPDLGGMAQAVGRDEVLSRLDAVISPGGV